MISKQLIRNRLRPQLARRQSVNKTRSFGFNRQLRRQAVQLPPPPPFARKLLIYSYLY